MAQYYTDFSEYTTGVQPSDWTERYNTGNWASTVETVAGATGGKVLRLVPTSTSRYLLSWDAIDADANRDNVEVLYRMRWTGTQSPIGTTVCGVGVRGSGGAGSEDLYVANLVMDSDPPTYMLFYEYDGGVSQGQQGATYVFTMSQNVWYYFRFRISGTLLQLKVWSGGLNEEPDWFLQTTDATISTAGWVGAWGFYDGADPYEYDIFAVGTNGDPAPPAFLYRKGRMHNVEFAN